jgi:hypothetical protein
MDFIQGDQVFDQQSFACSDEGTLRQRPTTICLDGGSGEPTWRGEIDNVAFLVGMHDSMARQRVLIAVSRPRIT